MRQKSFTLIELVVALSILSIGIVLVLRSYINVSSALDLATNRIEAICFLEGKMNTILEEVKTTGKIEGSTSGITNIGNRNAEWALEVTPLTDEALKDEEAQSKWSLSEARFRISWKEGNVDRDSELVTYVRMQKDTE